MYFPCFALIFLLCNIHTRLASADRQHGNTCGLSCFYLVQTATFADASKTGGGGHHHGGSSCSSALFAESFALCLSQYCNNNPTGIYAEISIEQCGKEGVTLLDGLSFTDALTAGQLDAVSYTLLNLSEPVTTSFHTDQDTFALYYRTINTFYTQRDLGTTYGGAMLAYFGVFIVLAMLRNAIVFLITSLSYSQGFFKGRPSLPTRLFQRFIVYPATFSQSHLSRPKFFGITFSIPTRAQSWTVLGYIILTIGLSLSCYTNKVFNENVWWPGDEASQLQRYLADRSGIMAVSQIPFIFLFAGRNNILLWLTGWSYQTFNAYHKWTSRVMWALAVVHGVTYTVTSVRSGDLSEEYAETYWRWGVVAVTSGSLILFLGVHNFRKVAYEIFLVIHIVLVAIFIGGLWWHMNRLGWMEYIYCSIAVWAFDRFIRLIRVTYFNAGFLSHSSAEISIVDGCSDPLLLIKVSTVRKAIATPGQYFFLHIGTIAPWSAHPFTVLEQDENGDYILVARVHKGLTQKLHDRAIAAASTSNTDLHLSYDLRPTTPKCVVRAGIDGLYGKSAPVRLYDTVLLIAGGVGITGCFSYWKYLLQHTHRTTRHVKLVWVVRQRSNTYWLRSRLEAALKLSATYLALDIEIYITSEDSSVEVGSNHIDLVAASCSETSSAHSWEQNDIDNRMKSHTKEYTEKPRASISRVKPEDKTITTHFGRPDMTQIVGRNVEDAPSSVAVLLCGPASMADEVRYHVGRNIERARGRLDYFEEALEW